MTNDIYVLGIHGFSSQSKRSMHNSGVALIKNGHLIFAADEERYSRIKNDGAFPINALNAMFSHAMLKPDQITLAILSDKDSVWQLRKIFKFGIHTYFQTGVFLNNYFLEAIKRTKEIRRELPVTLKKLTPVQVEHHLLHAASAYYTCPWSEATIITIDGMGDFSMSGITAIGKTGKIEILKRKNGFYSPGLFYMIITEILGFVSGRHEGKVTGLAALGNENFELKQIFSEFIKYDAEKNDFYSCNVAFEINDYISQKWVNGFNPRFGTNSFDEQEYLKQKPFQLQTFRKKLLGFRKEDIAYAAQVRLEEIVTEHCSAIIKMTGIRKLVLAGGVFANVKLNQKIKELSIVDDVYIYPAMNDSGLSAGAALYGYFSVLNNKYEPRTPDCIYLGDCFSDKYIEDVLNENNIKFHKPISIEKEIASYLAFGLIVAHFDGRAEYGPRALGNRSIFVSAENSNVNVLLNKRLNRTEFMPFAPVMMEEHASKYLLNWNAGTLSTSYMTMTFNVSKKMKEQAPAAVHLDGTARPQTVSANQNPRLHQILKEYYTITGVPVLVNTSFNLHEEPIVNSPEDAIKVLVSKGVDILILNSYIIKL